MRAVKAVLDAVAKFLKVQHEEDDEYRIVLKAMTDVNLPKFISEDIPLFESIVRDIFPDVTLPIVDRQALVDAVLDKCKECYLQPTPW